MYIVTECVYVKWFLPAGWAVGSQAAEMQCSETEQKRQRHHRGIIPLEGRERLGPLLPTADSHILCVHASEPTQGLASPLTDTWGTHNTPSDIQDKHACWNTHYVASSTLHKGWLKRFLHIVSIIIIIIIIIIL